MGWVWSRLEVDRRRGATRCRVGGLVDGRADAELLLDLLLDLVGEVGIVEQELAHVLLALAELVALVRVPGARFAHEPLLDTDIDKRSLATDAHAIHDVELGLLEWRRELVLDNLDARPVSDGVAAVLQ